MNLVDELKKLIKLKLYFSSLVVAFTIPDICSALSSNNGEATGDKYKSWFNKYLKKYQPFFTGDHAYYYRCSLLHQAKLKHPSSDYESVYFTISKNIKFHNCTQTIGDKKHYICDIDLFCKDILEAYNTWYIDNKNTDNFKRNTKTVFKIYENSLGNVISTGVNVIT